MTHLFEILVIAWIIRYVLGVAYGIYLLWKYGAIVHGQSDSEEFKDIWLCGPIFWICYGCVRGVIQINRRI